MSEPPFPSFANSAIAQIEVGLMDGWLLAVIEACEKRQAVLDE
jgi:hypothetical protein